MVSFPRFTRPHTILIKHKINEDEEMNAIYEETELKYVKFDETYGMRQSQRGIDSADDTLCIIDLGDLCAIKNDVKCQYINCYQYQLQGEYFSIFKDDIIVFESREYTVNSINEINPFGNNPFYIEVRSNG